MDLVFLFYLKLKCTSFVFFFFQAEDGIRDRDVTGVQTCALPISCATPIRSSQTVVFTPWATSEIVARNETVRSPWRGADRIVAVVAAPPAACFSAWRRQGSAS